MIIITLLVHSLIMQLTLDSVELNFCMLELHSSPWGCNESAMARQLSTAQRTGLLESFLGENVFVNENVNERWESQDLSE